jgi:hypothetical protein
MSESIRAKTRRDGSITIKTAALSYSVAYTNGDFSGSFPKADRVVIRDRHAVAGLRKGADPIPTFSFSVHMREFTDGSSTTIVDTIERTGLWVAAVSTGGAAFEQFLCDVVMTVNKNNDSADHVITMTMCHLTYDFAEGDPDSITINGECYGTVSRTGPA